jgi:hypothetical protein
VSPREQARALLLLKQLVEDVEALLSLAITMADATPADRVVAAGKLMELQARIDETKKFLATSPTDRETKN